VIKKLTKKSLRNRFVEGRSRVWLRGFFAGVGAIFGTEVARGGEGSKAGEAFLDPGGEGRVKFFIDK
jgi:hypothetical protein